MTRMTLFAFTLVQDSALSVSGVDRETASDQPFSLVDRVPVLSGRGLKGAAVAMARRFFNPLPRSVSEETDQKDFRRSAWEFSNARPDSANVKTHLRAGVGIRQKTGARASGVLYDREVVPAGTRWPLVIRVDWDYAGPEAEEAEGILGYVLSRHWACGRCWLGGGVARGLGWCHIEDLRAWRLDPDAYDRWVQADRDLKELPAPLETIPAVAPTRSWCFRTLDVHVSFGEYRPDPSGQAWGLDMLAIGPHDSEGARQPAGTGVWARPSWARGSDSIPDLITTDRAVLTEQGRPLLPGSSLRGPMRHAFSRIARANGATVQDPHPVEGKVGDEDPAGRIFGTVVQSSRVLIRDARAADGWAAARLHMHAEDEFSAGAFGNSKHDAVRVLRGEFPVRIVVEGPDESEVKPLTDEIDRLVKLGALGHLPIGGHKTRGAGWGRWRSSGWIVDDVVKERDWHQSSGDGDTGSPDRRRQEQQAVTERGDEPGETTWIQCTNGAIHGDDLTLGDAAQRAQAALNSPLVAWWCEPTLNPFLTDAPKTFGRQWPQDNGLRVDEVLFFTAAGCWQAARTAAGIRWVLIKEVREDTGGARQAEVVRTPARLHGDITRFAQAADLAIGDIVLREWHVGGEVIGFTLEEGTR